jgi:hypothetical protein
MTQRRSTRLPDDEDAQVSEYLRQHNLTDAEAGRIAYRRLLKSPPSKAERESAKAQRGNPEWTAKTAE